METLPLIDSYEDKCSVCSSHSIFEFTPPSIRESYRCKVCSASLREREQARVIAAIYGGANISSLSELAIVSDFRDQVIWEPGTTGSFRKYFNALPYYYRSDFYDQEDKNSFSLPYQNLEQLSYKSETFDLVITSDILEHVSNPKLAFHEIARVLKIYGHHIFTVPIQHPAPGKSLIRASVHNGQLIHHHPERFHGNGKGGKSLVFTEFGYDIVDLLSEAGFTSIFIRPKTLNKSVDRVITILCQKIFKT